MAEHDLALTGLQSVETATAAVLRALADKLVTINLGLDGSIVKLGRTLSRRRLDRHKATGVDADDAVLALVAFGVRRDFLVTPFADGGDELSLVALKPIVFFEQSVRLHRSRPLRSEVRCATTASVECGEDLDVVVRRAETRDGTTVLAYLGAALVATTFLAMVFGFLVRLSNDGVRGSLDDRVVRIRLLMELRKRGMWYWADGNGNGVGGVALASFSLDDDDISSICIDSSASTSAMVRSQEELRGGVGDAGGEYSSESS